MAVGCLAGSPSTRLSRASEDEGEGRGWLVD